MLVRTVYITVASISALIGCSSGDVRWYETKDDACYRRLAQGSPVSYRDRNGREACDLMRSDRLADDERYRERVRASQPPPPPPGCRYEATKFGNTFLNCDPKPVQCQSYRLGDRVYTDCK